MPKEEAIKVEGIVLKTLPNAMFKVELENKQASGTCAYFRKNAHAFYQNPAWRQGHG